MSHFTTTPQALLNTCREYFLSERFSDAFEVMRECFDPEEVGNDVILQLLKGEMRIQPVYGSIRDVELVPADLDDENSEDAEYHQTAKEILENYDFLIRINDTVYQVAKATRFDLSLIVSANKLMNTFKEQEGEAIELKKWSFVDDLEKIADLEPSIGFHLYPYAVYFKGFFFMLEPFRNPFYEEFCKVYEQAGDACQAFANAWEIEVE